MADENELENFRKQWENELEQAGSIAETSDAKSKPQQSHKQQHPAVQEQHADDLAIANYQQNVNDDLNSAADYHPFVIVENLLKRGACSQTESETPNKSQSLKNDYFSSTESDTVKAESSSQKRVKLRHFKEPTSKIFSKLKSELGPKPFEDKSERFLDRLISDLDEITEIPFFDINLPRELALNIFQHLELLDLCRCAQVSSAWRNLAEDELLWYRICRKLGEHTNITDLEGGKWKSHAEHCVVREKTLTTNWKGRIGRLHQLQYIKGGILCDVNSHNGRIVAGYSNGQVKMWQIDSEEECVFQPSSTSLIINEDQDEGTLSNLLVCTAISDTLTLAAFTQGIVDVWQNDGSTTPTYSVHCPRQISHAVLAPSQPLLLSSFGPFVRADYSPNSGELDFHQLQTLDMCTDVKHLHLFPAPVAYQDVGYLSAISTSNIVTLHRPGRPPDEMTQIHNMIDAPITFMDVNSSTKQLAIGLSTYGGPFDGFRVKVYELDSGRLVTTLAGHTYFVSCLDIGHAPVNHLVTGCGDRKVRVYDMRVSLPSMTLVAHSRTVTQVQMDDWKIVSGGEDGVICVWDQRMALKLWDWHNRHPVRYCQFDYNRLIVANVPQDKFPQMEEFESVLHKRYRGSIQVYDFLSDQSTQGVPEICLSNYDMAEGYDYNIRLAVPYDNV